MAKQTIDDEIKNLLQMISDFDDTHPDYLPPEIKELQNKVITVHAHVEVIIEMRILNEINNLNKSTLKSDRAVILLLNELPFMRKLNVAMEYEGDWNGKEVLYRSIKKLNKYRNEFAHPVGFSLREEYSYKDTRGKENIRNLLRNLSGVLDSLGRYLETRIKKSKS